MAKLDARKLDHKTREALRIRAVQQIEAGESPEVVARALGVHRSAVYQWLARYREGGLEALKFKGIPGRKPKLSGPQLRKLYRVITQNNPRQLQFEFALWTRGMVREYIRREFGVRLSETSVGRLLRKMGLSPQKPLRKAYEQDPERVRHWLETEYPRIRRRAKRKGADIFFADEAGVRSDHHWGRTWAERGKTPVVRTTGRRYGLNMISAISPRGAMRFMTVEGRVDAEAFVEFLKRLVENYPRRIFLIVDNHSVHRARKVREFVASTGGKLELYYLPPYSPELNPTEFVWTHVKHHGLGRRVIEGAKQMKRYVISVLRSMQRRPGWVRRLFEGPHVRYTLA